MAAQYKLGPLIQQDGYMARDLFKINENSPTYQSDVVAQIHIRNKDGQTVIMTPACPLGIIAQNHDHAISFLKSLLGAIN